MLSVNQMMTGKLKKKAKMDKKKRIEESEYQN